MSLFIEGFLAGIAAYAGLIFSLGVLVTKSPRLSGKIMARVTRQLINAGKEKK